MMVVNSVLRRGCQLSISGITVMKIILISGYMQIHVINAIFHFFGVFMTLKFYTAKLQGNITQEQVRNVGGLVRKMEKKLFSYGDRRRVKGLSRF